MTSILFEQKPKVEGPEPFVAALYSVVPGVGQFYNGKTRKGVLFLGASFISLLMFYASLNPDSTLEISLLVLSIIKFFTGFIFKFTIEPSPSAQSLMESIRYGGAFSYSLLTIIIIFVFFAMFDAYIDAAENHRKFEK